MKKALLMAAAAVAAAPACAEWTLLTGGETGDNKWFIDHGTVRVNGNLRRVWALVDKPVPDKDGDRSGLTFYEMDCSEIRFRILQSTYYKGSMGSGAIGGTTDGRPSDWRYVGPGTVVSRLIKTVCS